MANEVFDALNRIADAIFAQVKVQKRAVAVSEEMLAMQKVNLAVTKALEESLTRTTDNGVGITRLPHESQADA